VCEAYELETDLVVFIRAREINHEWKICAISPGRICHLSFSLAGGDEPISIKRNPTTGKLCPALFRFPV